MSGRSLDDKTPETQKTLHPKENLPMKTLTLSAITFTVFACASIGCAGDDLNKQAQRTVSLSPSFAVQKTYALTSPTAQAVLGAPSIPVRARAFALPLTHLPRLRAAPVDSKALLATLETFVATLRPDLKTSLSRSVVDRNEAYHVNLDSVRAWADKNSGFVSLIDVKHRATGRRTIFSAADAVNAILDKLGSLEVFGLQAGQSLDVVAVKAIRGEMVDAKTYKPMWVLSPGETKPTKRHTLSYRVIFGRRQGGIPLLRSSFVASITPQGRLVELIRLWHRVIVQSDNTKLEAMHEGLDAWLRSQLITRGLSATMAVEPKGCGYLEPLMRDKTTSFAPTCLAIATDAKNPKGRLFKLPLATTAKEVTP